MMRFLAKKSERKNQGGKMSANSNGGIFIPSKILWSIVILFVCSSLSIVGSVIWAASSYSTEMSFLTKQVSGIEKKIDKFVTSFDEKINRNTDRIFEVRGIKGR